MNESARFEDVACEAETAKAIRVIIEDEAYWIPKSQVTEDSEVWRDGDYGTLVITGWIAKEKGLL